MARSNFNRRKFLRDTAATVTGLSLFSALPEKIFASEKFSKETISEIPPKPFDTPRIKFSVIGDLKSHAPHTHAANEIIVMLQGNSEMLIGQKTFKGKEGSVYFMESNILHGITNVGATPSTYFAIQFE